MLAESHARQSQSEAPVDKLRILPAQETMFSTYKYANPEASQLLWSCVPNSVAVDSPVCVELALSWHIDTLKKQFAFHIPCLLLILVTPSLCPHF